MDAMARWVPETQTETSKFWHSAYFGVSERYGIWYCSTGIDR
jgi:hypothetical protein